MESSDQAVKKSLVESIIYGNKGLLYSAYGEQLPHMNQKIDEVIEAHKKHEILSIGSTFTAMSYGYKIEEKLGTRTYRVSMNAGEHYFLKVEALARLYDGPRLHRATRVYAEMNKRLAVKPEQWKNFLTAIEMGNNRHIGYTVFALADCNLHDMLVSRLNNAPICRSTALQISAQTLQAINDLHTIGFMHRDIRPRNFFIGLDNKYRTIYMGGFEIAWKIWRDVANMLSPSYVPKATSLHARFQSRAYHAQKESRRIDDIESWIFMCVYIFCRDLLPWRHCETERDGFESKCRFVNGEYDLHELEPYFRPMLESLRKSLACDYDFVNFPYYAMVLEKMASDWKIDGHEPLEWEPHDGRNVASRDLEREKISMQPILIQKPKKYEIKNELNLDPRAIAAEAVGILKAPSSKAVSRVSRKKKNKDASVEETQEELKYKSIDKKKTQNLKKAMKDVPLDGDNGQKKDESKVESKSSVAEAALKIKKTSNNEKQ